MNLIKPRTLVLITTLLICSFLSYSQQWQHKFGGNGFEQGNCLIQANDDGYLSVGQTNSYGDQNMNMYVVKTDIYGKLDWQQVISTNGNEIAYAAVQNTAGDYYVGGYTDGQGAGGKDIFISKLNSSGGIIWSKTFGGPLDDICYAMTLTNSNDLIVTGSTRLTGSGNDDIIMMKISPSGMVIWNKTYGGSGNDVIYDIDNVHDGGFIMCGKTASLGNNNAYVFRTNSTGDTLWTRAFNLGNSTISGFTGVTERNDNNSFAIVGTGVVISYYNMMTMVLDLQGNVVSSSVSQLIADFGSAITSTSDGGFITVGQYCNFGCTATITKFSSSGSKQWHKPLLFEQALCDIFTNGKSIIENKDGEIVFTGATYLPGSNADLIIWKCDENGNGIYDRPQGIISSSGPLVFCQGDSVTFSVPDYYENYQWIKYFGTNINYLPNNTNTFTASESGSYQCIISNSDGIFLTSLMKVTVVTPPNHQITASGPTTFCGPISNLSLSVPIDTSTTYQWYHNNNLIAGTTSNIFTVDSAGIYYVQMENVCGANNSASITINNSLLPSANMTSPGGNLLSFNGSICNPMTFSVPYTNTASYIWYKNGAILATGTNNINVNSAGTYWVNVSDACGTVSSLPRQVYVENYTSFITPLSNISGCGQFPVTLMTDYIQVPNTIQWYLNGIPIPGATGMTYSATANGVYTYTHYINCVFAQLATSNPLTIFLSGSPIPSISASGNTTSCTNVQLIADPPGSLYTWKKDNVVIPGANSPQFTATASGNYTCEIVASCSTITSNIVPVKIGLPIATISSNSQTICDGTPVLLSVNSTDPLASIISYQWALNGVDIAGANAKTYNASTAGNYTCSVTNACGAITTNTISLNIILINSLIPPLIKSTLCPGDSVILTTQQQSGYAYQWYKNSSLVSGANQNNYVTSTQGTFYVKVSTLGCTKISNSVTLTAVTPHPAVIWPSSVPEFCGSGSVKLNANTRDDLTYSWSRNGINLINGTSASVNANYAGNYKLIVTDSANCSNESEPFFVSNTGLGNLTIVPDGLVTFCYQSTLTLSSSIAANNYQWKFNNSLIPGTNNDSLSASSTGMYSLTASNSQGCSSYATIHVKQNSDILIGGILTHPECGANNGEIIGSTSALAPASYLWSNNETTSTISNLSAGTYTVLVNGANGCSKTKTFTLTEQVLTASLTSSGSTNLCQGENIMLSSNSGPGYTYQWKKYGNIIAGANTANLTVSSNGNYRVTITNAFGCSKISNPINVSVSSLPQAIISANGPTQICQGSIAQLEANQGSGLSYQWKLGGNDIPGATGFNLNATAIGNYKVKVTNSNGCTRVSNAISISLLPGPTAVALAQGPTTFCTGDSVRLFGTTGVGYSYQWMKGGTLINGATSKNYFAKSTGNYKVAITSTNGCTKNSNVIAVNVPCRIGELEESSFEIYPNPSSGIFKVVNGENEYATLEIKDVTGKLIYSSQLLDQETEIDLTKFPAGIYIAFLKTDNSTQMKKLIIR
ncbi:MAG: T9SS type A sorting domain-containing protein [Bacteroidia bacterium]|nr:T9SS type A sorting domain-containing protein [Bacteroidia bacterium]